MGFMVSDLFFSKGMIWAMGVPRKVIKGLLPLLTPESICFVRYRKSLMETAILLSQSLQETLWSVSFTVLVVKRIGLKYLERVTK